MKKVLKRSLSLLLAITIIFSSAAVGLGEVDFSGLFLVEAKAATSGTTGDCTWSLDGTVLAISGNGRMGDYSYSSASPWGNDITKVVIGNGVTSIGEEAFYDCIRLASITIPDSVINIGRAAFGNCTSLVSINIPDGVTTINSYTFKNCRSLTSIEIPNTVINIGEFAFVDCSKLESITLPFVGASRTANNSPSAVFGYIFGSVASTLSSYSGATYQYYNSAYSFPYYYYFIPTSLKHVTITDATQIPYNAFYNCSYLESIYIPNTVTYICDYAFYNCRQLDVVIYGGNEKERNDININSNNNCIINATWHTDKCVTFGEHTFSFNCDDACNVCGQQRIVTHTYDNSCDVQCNICGGVRVVEHKYQWIFLQSATCVDDGLKQEVCVICGDRLMPITIAALGHASSDWIVTCDATCTANGSKHKECALCGEIVETATISATGHTSVKDAAVAPTCTTAGKTEGSHCSVCNEVIVAQATIPAIGHNPSDWIIDSFTTVSAPGSKHIKCTTCGETLETETIPQLKPETPKVATENALTGVLVKWNAVECAVKYNVYRRQGGQSAWTLVGTTTGTTLLDKNVKSGIYYCYSVRAYNNAGQYSDFIQANTNTRKYMAVPKLTGISNATNGLYIKWNTVAGVTNGYRVYRRGAGQTYWKYLGTVKTTYYTDSEVKNNSGEYYRYTVIADGGYHSKFDTNGLYLKRLANPTLKSATSAKAGITVKWDTVKGTTGYYVYRKTANSGWVRIAAVGGTNNTTYLDKTARKGTPYTYTVRAVCGATTSSFNPGISCKDKY